MSSSLAKLGLSEEEYKQLEKCLWVATEKVHGANFSFVYENGNLRYAKRKHYLSWSEDFFGFQLVVKKLENRILSLFEQLKMDYEAERYIIYGELFGGKYPHEEVLQEEALEAIQTGVYYSPTIEFGAFDIAMEKGNGQPKCYLDYQTAVEYFERFKVNYIQPLLIGKFNEVLNCNTRINSMLPEQLGLPALEENLIEGVVVKPYNLSHDGSLSKRPIVKLKNTEFEEQKKFHEARKWTFIPDFTSNTEELSFLLDELRNYVTLNRLESAISKIGALDRHNEKRLSEIEDEFLKDVFVDFNEENGDLLKDLSSEQNDWLLARVKANITELVITRLQP